MATANPYTRPDNVEGQIQVKPEYPVRERAYTEATEQGPFAVVGSPYADKLKTEPGSTPDPLRIQQEQPKDYRQDARQPWSFWRSLGLDRKTRESVQRFIGVTPSEKGINPGAKRFADRPGVRSENELRVTAQMSPATGGLTVRPMTGMTPKRFNGVHSSMADHKRMDGPIFGMRPAYRARSTWRLDPIPWGERVVDMQAVGDDYMGDGPYTQQSPLPSNNRAHRLQ